MDKLGPTPFTESSGSASSSGSPQGFALLASLLLLSLLAMFSLGLIHIVLSSVQQSTGDLQTLQTHYTAAAAMEKMVVDLNYLYSGQLPGVATPVGPSVADIEALGAPAYQPSFPGITLSEYSFTVPNTAGIPDVETGSITAGPNQGLLAHITPVHMSVTAEGAGGEVVKLVRKVEFGLLPVFQFGVFSEADLSYFSNGLANLEGRVHTNGNLFLAAGSSKDLVFHSRVTVAGEVLRAQLANGLQTAVVGWDRSVKIPTAPRGCEGLKPACRDLLLTEGSNVAGPASADTPGWVNLSHSTYGGKILNGETGAKALRMPFVASGVPPIELIRRPRANEVPSSLLGQSRLYSQAQLRVLISDDPSEHPGGLGVGLVNLAPYVNEGIYGWTDTAFAEGDDLVDLDFVRPPGAPAAGSWPLIDGYLLVEARQTDGTYSDVTLEWLNLGLARENPDAILKFQALKDENGDGIADYADTATNRQDPLKFLPLGLYDTREGEVRDTNLGSSNTSCAIGGIMNLVELDVGNLKRWLEGVTGTTGTSTESISHNGYLFYFSDRRGMLPNPDGDKVGEYGFEDIINPNDSASTSLTAGACCPIRMETKSASTGLKTSSTQMTPPGFPMRRLTRARM